MQLVNLQTTMIDVRQMGFFTFLNKVWGPFTIDRFASAENKKLERFNSLFWNPGTERVDAFLTSWEYENN